MRPPFATLRVADATRPHEKIIEVLVDGEAVAQIPATSVTYSLEIGGVSQMQIGVHVHDAVLVGGQRHPNDADMDAFRARVGC